MVPTRTFIETHQDIMDELYNEGFWNKMELEDEKDEDWERYMRESKFERAYTRILCWVWRHFLKPFGVK